MIEPAKVGHLDGCPEEHDTDNYVLVGTEEMEVEGHWVPKGGVIACPVKDCVGVATWNGPFSPGWRPPYTDAELEGMRMFIQQRYGADDD
jgi:hypothetical protein